MHSEMIDEIIAYQKCSQDDFYALLGCDPSASPEQIQSEYKARARQLHPDKAVANGDQGEEKSWDQLTDAFQCLKRARDVLMDPEKRKLYDDWLAGGIAMPFSDWLAKRNVIHMAMHWATPKGPSQMSITSEGVKGQGRTARLPGADSSWGQPTRKVSQDFEGRGSLQVPSEENPVFDSKSDMPARLWQRRQSSLLEKFRKYEI